ncbi:MAG: glutamine amidotransferase-related protein, partial [Chitinophagales bacterium]
KDFEAAGMMASGLNPQQNLIEIVELKDHPWFVGVQFHPELKSKVEKPHPLFIDFVKAAIAYKEGLETVAPTQEKRKVKQQA